MLNMNPSERTDADLVAQVLAEDREAFAYLYDGYARPVRAVLVGVSCHRPSVEDMTQECFLSAYRNLANLREPARFAAWIVGIARQKLTTLPP
jgi:DNA-directed RNA polymerase specialized sigma24 family protein